MCNLTKGKGNWAGVVAVGVIVLMFLAAAVIGTIQPVETASPNLYTVDAE